MIISSDNRLLLNDSEGRMSSVDLVRLGERPVRPGSGPNEVENNDTWDSAMETLGAIADDSTDCRVRLDPSCDSRVPLISPDVGVKTGIALRCEDVSLRTVEMVRSRTWSSASALSCKFTSASLE